MPLFNDEVLLEDTTPKPIKLLKEIIRATVNNNDLILDFFSGTNTTQQSVIELNKEDNEKKA